ncbi:MAG: ATP synthase F1 subunit delta [Elusimicrobia bacterium RIFOXYA2_FULL_50_26]|nr:MAG: ATP synthase F1 subunit delta [Elusimicrobia bacterium RIFOXYA2_FULL_50_26]
MKRIAYAYAAALFSVAIEKKAQAATLEQLTAAASLMSAEKRLMVFFRNPSIPSKEKNALIERAFASMPLVKNFLLLAVRRKVVHLAGDIAAAYKVMLDQSLGQEPVTITSAAELSNDKRRQLAATLAKMLGAGVIPDFKVDPGIMAGIVIRYRDKIIDGSIKGQYEALKRSLVLI